MNELIAILFSWTLMLTGFQEPVDIPMVVTKPHSFFVENACNGRPACKVLGWYKGGKTIYIDEKFDIQNSMEGASLIVHEMTHYLQAVKRARADDAAMQLFNKEELGEIPCGALVAMEREAYAVQREFLTKNGSNSNFGNTPKHFDCQDE